MNNLDDWLVEQSSTKHSKIAQKKSKRLPRARLSVPLHQMGLDVSDQEQDPSGAVGSGGSGDGEQHNEVAVADVSVPEEEQQSDAFLNPKQDSETSAGHSSTLVEEHDSKIEKGQSALDELGLDEDELDAELAELEQKLQIGRKDDARSSNDPTLTGSSGESVSAMYGGDAGIGVSVSDGNDDDLFDLMGGGGDGKFGANTASGNTAVLGDISAYIAKSRAEQQKPVSLFDD